MERNKTLAAVICLLVVVSSALCAGPRSTPTGQNRDSSKDSLMFVNSVRKYSKMTNMQLQKELKNMKRKIELIRRKEKAKERDNIIKALARDFIDHAYREKNSTIQKKELEMAIALIKDPKKQMGILEKENKTKEDANFLLDRAYNFTDPKLQEKFMLEAEKKIYWLETGKVLTMSKKSKVPSKQKKPKKVSKKSPKVSSLKKKQPDPGFLGINKSIEEQARDAALDLIDQVQKESNSNTRAWMMELAYNLLHKPKSSLKKYWHIMKQRQIIQDKSQHLMDRVSKLKDESKRDELIYRLDEFYRHPRTEVKKIKKARTAKYYKEAKQIAVDLLKEAHSDSNPVTQQIKIKVARRLIRWPIKTLSQIELNRKRHLLLEKVPNQCKKRVEGVFQEKLSRIDETDYNKIEEKAWERIHLYSLGKPWAESKSYHLSVLDYKPSVDAKLPSDTDTPRHPDMVLANKFDKFLSKKVNESIKSHFKN